MRKLTAALPKWAESIIILLFVLANLSWIARSTAPWPDGDSYLQAEKVLLALEQGIPVTPSQIGTFLETISHGGRPPLYQLASIPLVLIFGSSQDAFATINLLLLALLMFAVGRTATLLTGKRAAGLLAMVAVACFAPLIHMTSIYRLYYGGMTLAALTLWLLTRLWNDRTVRNAWLTAISSAATILTHPMAGLVLLVPLLTTWAVLGFASWRGATDPEHGLDRIRGKHLITRGLLPSSLVPILVAAAWYFTLGRPLVHMSHKFSSAWAASFRGSSVVAWNARWAAKGGIWYAATAPLALSTPITILVVVASLCILWRGTGLQRWFVAWLLAAYLLIGFRETFTWYYGSFGLPLVAVVLAAGLTLLPRPSLRTAAMAAVLGSSLLNFSLVTEGVPRPTNPPCRLARLWGAGYGRPLLLTPSPPVSAHWPFGDVVSRIVRWGIPKGPWFMEVFVGPRMLASPCNFTRARFWPDKRLRFLEVAEPSWGREFPLDAFLRSRWIAVTHPLTLWRESTNPYQKALASFLQDPPPEFLRTHQLDSIYTLPPWGRLKLLRRTAPLTVAEVDATMDHLELPPKYLTRGDLVAAKLLEQEGRLREAIDRLEKAARVEGQPPALRKRIRHRIAELLAKNRKE